MLWGVALCEEQHSPALCKVGALRPELRVPSTHSQRPREGPPAPHKALFPHWSPTQAEKPQCPQRQTCFSLGPSVSVPKAASLEKHQCPADGQLCNPCPSAGAQIQGSGVALREAAELQPWDSHRDARDRGRQGGHTVTCQATAPGTTGEVLLCCSLPWESHPLQAAEPGMRMEQGREKVFQFCY